MSVNVDELVNGSNNNSNHNLNNNDDVPDKKNTLVGKLAFILIALLILAYVFFKFFWVSEEKKEVKKEPEQEQISNAKKRNDLGANFDPIEPPPPPPEESAEVQTDEKPDPIADTNTSNVANANVEQPKFKKVLAIPHNQAQGQGSQMQAYPSDRPAQNDEVQTTESNSNANALTSAKSEISVTAIQLDPNLYVETNTLIPCAMTTRFVSDVAGRINCVITKDVWSANHKVKLLEAGTKAFGSYQTGTLNHGQGRMFVIWEQLRTPDFKRIDLNETTEAGGELGEGGISGYIDSHFWQRFGGSLMLSMVNDVASAVADNATSKDRNVDYTANSRDAIAEMAKVALENSINIPPTMYKNQGDIINIVVGDDIDFSNIYDIKASGY